MSPLTLLAPLGFGALLPIFVSSNSGDEDDPVEPPDPETQIEGTDGDDVLDAVLNETVNGLEGDDTLTASETSDGAVLNGGEGADSLSLDGFNGTANGGAGDDTVSQFLPGGSGPGGILNGGDGDDSLLVFGGGNQEMPTVANGGNGDDTIIGAGTGGTINGEAGDDVIDVQGRFDGVFGGAGNVTIHGDSLDESGGAALFGGAGDDVLSTADGAGFDYRGELDGGDGNDTLTTELLGAPPVFSTS